MKTTKIMAVLLAFMMCFSIVLPAFAASENLDEAAQKVEIKEKAQPEDNVASSINVQTKYVTSTGTTADGFKYNIIDNSYVEITEYTSSESWVAIPSKINGYPVTSIGNYAFYGCDWLRFIGIMDSVTSIGEYAFSNCYSLQEIVIPDSVKSIGNYAFSECCALTSIEIPDGVTSISDHAFTGCVSLTSVTIPNSVTSIGKYAFSDCDRLRSIEIPSSVTSIGNGAFCYCVSLTNIEIPDSVTSIGDLAFYSCYSLPSIEIPNSVTRIGDGAFFDCSSLTSIEVAENNSNYCDVDGVLFNKDKTELIQYPIGKTASSYTIPDSVTSIGGDAFYSCDSLTSIEIPDSVTSIGSYAFRSFSSLTSIEIPDSVTSIGSYAFSDCDSLTSIEIPDSVTSIGGYAFYSCDSLTSIEIPNSVTRIGERAFEDCDNLTIYGVIGSYAETYANVRGILFIAIDLSTPVGSFKCKIVDNSYAEITGFIGSETAVVIPSEINGYPVTSIGSYAFRDCSSLTSIEIPDSVTSIGDYAFSDCDSLTSIEIPDSVTSISNYAFNNCYSLTSVTIPNSVTSIGGDAFRNCDSLTSIEIPDSVTSIGGYAFYSCGKLTSIEIPDSVTSIGGSAFYSCTSLTSIEIPDSVTSIGSWAFAGCRSLTSVTIGNSVESIDYEAFSSCSSLTSIEIPDSVTSIGSGAFRTCSSLTSIQIPDSVTSIGDYAFRSCDSLTNIEIPDSVTRIGDGAFWDCSSLTSVKIGNSVTSIGGSAFYSCDSLTSIEIPNSVTSIGNCTFNYCSSLTSIEIPDSVTSIGSGAFRACDSLTSIEVAENNSNYSDVDGVLFNKDKTELIQYPKGKTASSYTIPDSVTSIGSMAFHSCYSLTSIEIPDSVAIIGEYAFAWCDSLTSVKIGNSVTSIGDYAFKCCDNLTIYGVSGSYAETYANENGIPFVAIDLSTPEPTQTATPEPTAEPTQTATPVSSFKYNIVDNSYVEITGFIGSETEIVIPSEINGYPVTSIGKYGFSSCDSLTSIEIPDSVTSIGNNAFADCDSLTSVTIGNSVESIGRAAFCDCNSLTSIEIPDSVTSISDSAFNNCSKLTNIEVVGKNPSYCDVDGILFNKEKTAIVRYPQGREAESYIIPDSVTSIGSMAFCDCDSLTSIEIPNSVTSIGGWAFYECYSLTSIEIPGSVTSIGGYAFEDCSSLTSIEIPNGVTSIGYCAFWDCDNLTIYGISGSYAETYANENGIPFVAIEEPTPAPTVAPTTSAPTEAPSKVYTRAYIEYVGNSANTYITNNGKLPSNANLGHGATNMAEVLGAFAQYVVDTNNGGTGDVAANNATVPEMMYEDLTAGTLTKAQYVAVAQTVVAYIAEKGEAPAFVESDLGALSMNTLVRIFAKVVADKKATKELPATVEVAEWFDPLPIPPEDHATEFEDTYVIYAATSQLSYLTKNNKFSAYSSMNGEQVYQPELLGLFAQFIVNKNEGVEGPTSRNDATFAENSYENITGTSLTKAQYVKAAQDVIDYIESSLSAAAPGFVVTEAGTLSFETLLKTFATILVNYNTAKTLPETVEVSAWTAQSLPTPPAPTEAPVYQNLIFFEILKGAGRVVSAIEEAGRIPNYVTLDVGTRVLPGTMLRLFAATVSNINRGKAGNNMPLQVIDTPKNIVSETLTAGTLTKLQYIAIAQRLANVIYATDAIPTYVTTDLGAMNYCNAIYTFSRIIEYYLAYGFLPDTIEVQTWGTYNF